MKYLLMSLTLCTSVYGASSGTLTLQGTVSLVNDIVVAPAGSNNTTLNIVSGETNKIVANVSETSNNLLGYRVEVSSANNGELRNTSDVSKKTTYTLKYDTSAFLSLTSVPVSMKNIASLSGLITNNSEIRISVTAYPTAPHGVYSDTVTISIVSN